MKSRKEFLLSKKRNNNQEEIKEGFFFQGHNFSNEIFFKRTFFRTIKNTRRRWQKKFWKSWRHGYFSKREMITWKLRSGQHFLLEKQFFVVNFLRSSENSKFLKKQKRKIDDRFFSKKQITKKSENKFLEGLNKCFSAKRKKSIYLVRKNTIEKNKNKQEKGRNNKGDKTKTVLQKRDEQMKKQDFFFLENK